MIELLTSDRDKIANSATKRLIKLGVYDRVINKENLTKEEINEAKYFQKRKYTIFAANTAIVFSYLSEWLEKHCETIFNNDFISTYCKLIIGRAIGFPKEECFEYIKSRFKISK